MWKARAYPRHTQEGLYQQKFTRQSVKHYLRPVEAVHAELQIRYALLFFAEADNVKLRLQDCGDRSEEES